MATTASHSSRIASQASQQPDLSSISRQRRCSSGIPERCSLGSCLDSSASTKEERLQQHSSHLGFLSSMRAWFSPQECSAENPLSREARITYTTNFWSAAIQNGQSSLERQQSAHCSGGLRF